MQKQDVLVLYVASFNLVAQQDKKEKSRMTDNEQTKQTDIDFCDVTKANKIKSNIEDAKSHIEQALKETGYTRKVTLMAVSKTVGLGDVKAAIEAGVHDFGENRSTEFKRKHDAYPDQNWHFIGRIQTNKLKDIVGRACMIHSVASVHAAQAIDKIAAKLNIVQPILLEVNVSGEESKDGFSSDEIKSAIEQCATLNNIEVRGLMTMAPLGELDTAKRVFQRLYQIEEELKVAYNNSDCKYKNIALEELSMGMTQDFIEAVQAGSTIVRLGRSIFA